METLGKYKKVEEIVGDFELLYEKMLNSDIPEDIILGQLTDEIIKTFDALQNEIIHIDSKPMSPKLRDMYSKAYASILGFLIGETKDYNANLKKFGISVSEDGVYTYDNKKLLGSFGYDSPWNIFNLNKIQKSKKTFIWLANLKDLKKLYSELIKNDLIDCYQRDFIAIFSKQEINHPIKIIWKSGDSDLAYLFMRLEDYKFIPLKTQVNSIISKGKFFYNTSHKPILNIKQAKFRLLEKNKTATKKGQIIDQILSKISSK